MDKIKLVFGTYNSNPVGSTNDQFEAAYNNSYRPFLKLLYSYPKVKAALHYSGVLLEWFVEKHPEIITLLNEMVKRNQIEIVGGPFYNPILSIIPNKDRISQIEYLTTFIRKHFGKRTRGCWIPEKMWEPSLSSNIKNSGMEYTFLDEILFRESGIDSTVINRVYITEDQGKYIHVFPINKIFSEDFIEPEELIGKLLRAANLNSPD
ncbi:MAG: 4-alpha-glucanotransferase, partial [Spirochaetaceae bacterium]|nr:4-alpha-glucanotransferase [Spirochaetaceae bacterium]